MESISGYMSADHKSCDRVFANLEKVASKKKWDEAKALFQEFHRVMELHFNREEKILFPAFESRMASTAGPTEVMRMEHAQMRQLFGVLEESLKSEDKNQFLGHSETLMILMQQHNAKEEQILYHMADQVLAEDSGELLSKIQGLEA